MIYRELVALPPFISTPPLYPNRELFEHPRSLTHDRRLLPGLRRRAARRRDRGVAVRRTRRLLADAVRPGGQHRAGRQHRPGHPAVNAYTQTIGIYPESLKRQLRETLPLFGAQRLTSLGYACSVAIAMPQDAIEPIRRMCKWIVDEECDPEVVIPLWRLAQHDARRPPCGRRRRRPVGQGLRRHGRVCGLGRESSRALAAAGAHVVLAARNEDALAQRPSGCRGGARCPDLVGAARPDVAGRRSRGGRSDHDIAPAIDVLMNNAGVCSLRSAGLRRVRDSVRHKSFRPLRAHPAAVSQLVTAGKARIVILSSGGHVMGDVDFDDPNWEGREYDKFVAYGASKTANVLHTVELDRRHRDLGIRAYAVHPGTVATSLARYMSRTDFSQLRKMAAASTAARGEPTGGFLDFTTPEHGAATQVWAAVSPELADKGALYLEGCGVSEAVAPYARDERRAADWWDLSEKLCDRS